MAKVEEMSLSSSDDNTAEVEVGEMSLDCSNDNDSAITTEKETVFKEHITFYQKMKEVLERGLAGLMAARKYFKENKPTSPQTSPGNLFDKKGQRFIKALKKCKDFYNQNS